jgi:general secretion pathway protein J
MNTGRSPAAQSGFTLLELLVAITILTLVLTVALGAVHVGHRSFQTGIKQADGTAEIRHLVSVLRRQFLQLLPVIWEENGRDFIAFEGDRHELHFVGPAPEGAAGPGYLVYKLAVENLPDGKKVTVAFAPFDPGSDGFVIPRFNTREALTHNLRDISFDYFGTQAEHDQPSWHAVWPSNTGRLPTIVRMQLTSSTIKWPDLLFQTHVEVEG